MRVLIVGAGIGGLTLAQALRRRGHDPELVELAPVLKPVGAGIVLGVNAQRVLAELGLLERVTELSVGIERAAVRDADGRVLTRLEPRSLASELKGASFLAIHRGDLQTALLEGMPTSALILDSTVEALESSDTGVDVVLRGGARERFDLVVGADGIRSGVRPLLFGDTPLDYSGYTCWRIVVDLGADEFPGTHELWGRGKRVGLVPLSGGRVYSFLVANAQRGEPDPWGDLDAFRAFFAEFSYPPAQRLLRAVDDTSRLIHHDLEELRWLPAWHRGCAVLLGDAAHAFTPNMGQGACMAIEDAYVLDRALAREPSIPAALVRYEQERRGRVKWVQDTSRRLGKIAQWSGRLACQARNLGALLTPARVAGSGVRRLIEGAPV